MKSMSFEELNGPLVLLRGRKRSERAKVFAPAGLRILLAGIQAVLAGGEFPDHACDPYTLTLLQPALAAGDAERQIHDASAPPRPRGRSSPALDVGQQDVGLVLERQLQRLGPVFRAADDLDETWNY